MSPSKPPHSGTPRPKGDAQARRPEAQGSQDGHNAWDGYDDAADDWSLSDDKVSTPVPQAAEATGQLQSRRPVAAPAPSPVPDGYVLAVLGGGLTYALSQSPMRVGRGGENDVVLADASVSRAHARLEHRADGWHIVDLGSGNGIVVDGRRVIDAALPLGAEVAIGQVRLQMQRADAAAQGPGKKLETHPKLAAQLGRLGDFSAVSPPAPAPGASMPAVSSLRPTQGRLWRVALGACAIVALGLAGRGYLANQAKAKAAYARCEAGITAFGAQRWDDAEQALADAQAIAPDHALTARYMAALIVARRDAAALADAAERRQEGDLRAARAALVELQSTVLVTQATREAQAYGAAATQVALQAETAMQASLAVEANALLTSLGAPPVRRDAQALAAWASERRSQAPWVQAAHMAGMRARRIPSLWDQAQTQSAGMRAAIRAFRGGSAEHGPTAAMAILGRPNSAASGALAQALQRFTQLWQTAIIEHRGKRAFAAIKLFTEARAVAVRIVGEGSAPGKQVDGKLADMYYVLGVQALMAGQLAEASEALHTAIARDPRHALSLRKLDELDERATRMVDEAEFMRETHASRAQEMLRQVVQAMPASSAASLRARRLLAGPQPKL